MEKFNQYCNPYKNVMWEIHKFSTRNQQPGETIDQYVTDLKMKAQTCEFAKFKGYCTEKMKVSNMIGIKLVKNCDIFSAPPYINLQLCNLKAAAHTPFLVATFSVAKTSLVCKCDT